MNAMTDILPLSIATSLRQAMRGMAQSVVLITTAFDGRRHAMTATAVCPVSMDPPVMLMCINRSASAHTALSRGRAFYINLLAARHELVARQCSGAVKGEERFESGEFSLDEGGLPYLTDAQAVIRCARDGMMSYGTHDAVFGRVESVHVRHDMEPLLYLDGRYTTPIAAVA